MPEALPLQPGDPRKLGSFEITGRLGVGEQGAVFLGGDPAGGPVAVKVLHVRLSGEPAAGSRFADAFSAARKVSGFCTAAILAADVDGDRPYVVSECVDGPSLQQLVDEEGPRGGIVVERVAVGMAVALAAVHRAGALHHNLKPGNVLLGPNGPRMSDFGIVHALDAVNAAFTGHNTEDPSYKAPEQLSGMGLGPAADVFSWAATLLFAATGKPPFGDGSPSEVMQRIVYDEPDLSGAPDSLHEVMTAALAKDPAQRPTAAQILERLLGATSPLPGRLPPSMAEEGRALAAGTAPQQTAPQQAAPQQAAGTAPQQAADPAPRQNVPPPSPPLGAPQRPLGVAPQLGFTSPGPAQGAPAPALPLFGKLSLTRRPRPAPEPEPEPLADLDPAAFEATTTFHAVGSDRQEEPAPADQTARFDAVGPDPTAMFDAVDLQEHANGAASAPHFVPGLGRGRDTGERGASPLSSIVKMRRPSNHVLGVALSLFIGVGVGIAIITLVLWPQLKDDGGGPPPNSTNTSSNRPVTTIPASFAGTWKGTAVNTNRKVAFPVEVTFEAGGTTAHAVYPREKCTGTLTLTSGTESVLKMNLAIAKPCTSGVVEVTRRPDGTLQYMWNRPGTGLGYGGKLTRG
ncbi:serine/threonine protein kinase [Actinomadura formosensis]|uniref:serine/threonine protein kinase n=1 Tax=Actinomadura formosensis TaxID=60706 RepID=UPI003D8DD611